MAETLIRHYIWGILIFALFIVGGVTFITGFVNDSGSAYSGTDTFESFNETFDVTEDITGEVEGIEGSVRNAEADFGIFGVLNSLINSAWNTLKLLFGSFEFMDSVFGGMGSVFGVPPFIGAILSLMVTVLIAFVIYSAFFQKDI